MVREVNRCLLLLFQQDMYGVRSASNHWRCPIRFQNFKGAMQRMTQGMYSVSGDEHGVTRCGTQPGLDQRNRPKLESGVRAVKPTSALTLRLRLTVFS